MRSSLHFGGQDGGHQLAVHQPDLVLTRWARGGDPDAFGVLYLRHHHAAWRMAHGASGFAHQCPEIVIEAFARVLRPGTGTTRRSGSCRSELLAEVRRVAAQPTFSERRPELAVYGGPDEGDVLTASPLLVEVFRRLDEPHRTAWWLLEVERLTPRETAAVMRLDGGQVAGHHAKASREITSHMATAVTPPAAAACRPAAERIAAGAALDEVENRHLRSCPVCRMRGAERLRPDVALCDSVPPMPLLSLECHRRWRTG
jgi:DNA-directed RNA polymerase specialized sigma24 family protein